ncbi:MAG: type IV secretory system conjugative DNA transfer family protein [Phenylobacterium sp.]|uniref:type IV secretory system conjugative DNA transfer family protein n=1 Tax=Phenylobacterium sp. TaxID=1871053 RepID=UPI002734C446|nr:type IV secretory system conjugative DNA transfer family protein [Phenylobacterium sp.]MDP3749302.1 type IV secretory system conjugative DNA transfer family protein [Phenylobacterium sp.]
MTRFENAGPGSRALLVVSAAGVALLVFLVLAGLVAVAGLGHLTPDLDMAAVPAWLWYNRADPAVATWTRIGALASGLFVAGLAVAAASQVRRSMHGAARWAREDELRRGGLRSRHGIVLGERDGRLLVFGGSEHVMLYAPTRTGKGVGVVIPNLLTWPDSVIVLDIKRENWLASAGFRAAHGQAALLFDPLAPDGATARFNPLAHIPREDPGAVLDELQKIATMLFPVSERTDPFWSEAARIAFIGVGAYVAETPGLPFTLGEIHRNLTGENPREQLPKKIKERELSGRPLSPGCTSALQDFCSTNEKTFASIKQTATARLGLWLNPRVDQATSVSDFDLRELRTRPTSLYLATTPDNLARVAPLYNLLLQLFVDLNTRALPASGEGRPQVLVLLDEFARLGHAGVIAHGFSFLAGYGIRLLAVLQSPSQLRAAHGRDLAEEVLGNCAVQVVFAPREIEVAQALSERLGYYDQKSSSRSRPFGLGTGRRSVTDSTARRALMLPQELIALPDNQAIILRAGMPPVRARKLRYYRSKAFRARVMPAPVLVARPLPPPKPISDRDRARQAEQAELRAAEARIDEMALNESLGLDDENGSPLIVGSQAAALEALASAQRSGPSSRSIWRWRLLRSLVRASRSSFAKRWKRFSGLGMDSAKPSTFCDNA